MTVDKFSRRQFMKAGGIGLFGAFASRANAWSNQDRRVDALCRHIHFRKERRHLRLSHGSCDGRADALQSIKSVNPSFLTIDKQQTLPVCGERSWRVPWKTGRRRERV